jgi:hypothetical protein
MDKHPKIRIKIGVIGYLPFDFDRKLITKFKSDIFEIVGDFEERGFRQNADLDWWEYSNSLLEEELPGNKNADFSIWITYVPLKGNFYAKRLSSNRIVLSYFEIDRILKQEYIPVENFLLRSIYIYVLVYLRYHKEIPIQDGCTAFHDDTRGCIFDMNGNKEDVIYSLDKPRICGECIEKTKKDGVTDDYINRIEKEIQRIKKKCFYKIAASKERNPVASMIVSFLSGVLIGLVANIIFKQWF